MRCLNKINERYRMLTLCSCGAGTIGILLAPSFPSSSIVGIDIVPEAIQDANQNATLNGIFHSSSNSFKAFRISSL